MGASKTTKTQRRATSLTIGLALACGSSGGDDQQGSGTNDPSGSPTGADDGTTSTTTDPSTTAVTDPAETTAGTASSDDSGGPSVYFDVMGPGPVDLGGREQGPVIPETCAQAESGESTVGCRFYAVDLDQFDSSENDQYAIAVSNVQVDGPAEVVIEQKNGGVWETVAGPESVDAIGLHIFALPDHHHQGSGVMEGGTYRVSSDRPIIAYQFSPLAATSFTSDASMLYPSSSLDTLSYVPHWGGGQGGVGYITIVASQNGTNIDVTPTAGTQAGTGVPAGSAGVAFDLSLDEGDIAEVMASAANVSLSGTRIESDRPIAVFTAHECANIPADVTACDHLEEQLSGVRLWGQDFAASRVPVRSAGTPETSLWQIQASENNTSVTLTADAAVTGLPASPAQLDAGETLEFYVGGTAAQPGDFIVHASKPVAVMNYMCGADNPPGSGTGDPAMVQLSPNEQFLPRYVVLVPNQWETDVLVITRLAGSDITLDDAVIDDGEFSDIANGTFEVARIVVADGIHSLSAASGFSVVVAGYDEYDSYAYLGGSGTGKINPNPPG
jgi:IgGFc binding protein